MAERVKSGVSSTPKEKLANAKQQQLSDFLVEIENQVPAEDDLFTQHCLTTEEFKSADKNIIRLVSLAAQKMLWEMGNETLQARKTSEENLNTGTEERKGRYRIVTTDITSNVTKYGLSLPNPEDFTKSYI
ncbi:transcription initiation factor TFIID subunit 10-like [Belonocnema kinseyi]|uniref:transcription initiation factor TFIID subunit 10-like n=1 Tax=Belonocnema kinseyi TaxID=2817044 RepID=UPI00143D3326|nr:transcription initiation factor TFIID subunit 10-like [Belonocnema kinseyi]